MIHERHQNYGDWTVSLSPETPVEILKALDEGMFGTIYITPSRITDAVHPKEVARYAGIMRSREFTETQRVIGGSGLVWLLGDPNTPGPGVDETAIDLTGDSFVDAITAVLADTDLVPGNIIAESGSLPSGIFIGRTARYKLERICAQYSEAEYRVTPKAELDAGTPASLFDTFNDPTVFIKRGASGVDPDWKGVPLQSGSMGKDLTNWANRKLLVNNFNDEFTIVGEADEATSFRGPNGGLLSFTDVSVESEQGQANADERAAALLGHLVKERKIVRLVTENYDVFGSFGLGDTLFVWEPEIGFYDLSNKIEFRGQHYFPLALRVYGFDWPIKQGMGVWFQSSNPSADLFDLTDYFIPEEGQTTIDVGSAARTLVPPPTEPLGPVVAPITNPSDPPPAPDSPTIFGNERQLLVQAPVTSGGNPLPLSVRKLNVYASTTTGFTPGSANIIGYITVTRGNIKLGADVIKRFPWPEDEQTYVRVSALNDTTEGPASAEVAVTAGLIPSAAIINLVADKITAGTITASIEMTSAILTGGLIRTAVSGNRIEIAGIDPDRIDFYTGEAGEITAASTQVFDSLLRITSPEFVQDEFSQIDFYGQGGPNAFGRPRILISAGPSSSNGLDFIVGAGDGEVDLSTSDGSRLLLGSTADLIHGDDWIRVSNNSMSVVNDGTESFLIQDFQVVCRRELKLATNRLYLDGSAGPYLHHNGGNPELVRSTNSKLVIGNSVQLAATGQMQLLSNGDIQLWVDTDGGGGNNTNIVAWIPAAGGFRRLQVGAADSGGAGRRLTWFPN